MRMGYTQCSADRFSPHVDEETVRFHYVSKIGFDELVRARLRVQKALNRIEKRHLRAVLALDRLTPATYLGVVASRDGTSEVHAKRLTCGHPGLQTDRTGGKPGLASGQTPCAVGRVTVVTGGIVGPSECAVLTGVKTPRSAPPPLRGADGLSAGSTHACPSWLLSDDA